MSLINREDLMQTLGITDMDCEKCGWYSRTARRCKRGSDFEDACCAIDDALEVEPEPQWIPCSERLPEHGGRYLISVLDGTNRRTTVAPYLPRCKAWAMNGRMAYWKVIAWLPLPEPYREEEQDG